MLYCKRRHYTGRRLSHGSAAAFPATVSCWRFALPIDDLAVRSSIDSSGRLLYAPVYSHDPCRRALRSATPEAILPDSRSTGPLGLSAISHARLLLKSAHLRKSVTGALLARPLGAGRYLAEQRHYAEPQTLLQIPKRLHSRLSLSVPRVHAHNLQLCRSQRVCFATARQRRRATSGCDVSLSGLYGSAEGSQ